MNEMSRRSLIKGIGRAIIAGAAVPFIPSLVAKDIGLSFDFVISPYIPLVVTSIYDDYVTEVTRQMCEEIDKNICASIGVSHAMVCGQASPKVG